MATNNRGFADLPMQPELYFKKLKTQCIVPDRLNLENPESFVAAPMFLIHNVTCDANLYLNVTQSMEVRTERLRRP